VAGPLVASRDGQRLIVAEGGSLAILAPSTPAGMATPLALGRIGRFGILPVSLELDPDAQAPYRRTDPRDLAYVAAGRSGLWCVALDEEGGENELFAVRLDDSASDPAKQDSARWCSDVCTFELGGEPVLAALFASKDDTLVRVYPLGQLRNARERAVEATGEEVRASVEIAIGRHPAQTDKRANSFGLGIAADVVGPSDAMLYVALGTHGVARIPLSSGDLVAHSEGIAPEFGPVFGDGTWYASELGPQYASFPFRTVAGIERLVAPQALDVAVQSQPGEHFLYVALDHMGWVRFDLASLAGFGPEMPIEHQEGMPFTDPHGGWHARLFSEEGSTDPPFSYVRRLQLLSTEDGTYLAVAAHRLPFAYDPRVRTDGAVLSSDFALICGISIGAIDPLVDDHGHTLLYRIPEGGFNGPFNASHVHHAGGDEVQVAEDISVGRLFLFGGNESRPPFEGDGVGETLQESDGSGGSDSNTTFRVALDRSDLHELEHTARTSEDRPGCFNHVVGCFAGAEQVLLLGNNDGGVYDDGITTLCSDDFETDYDGLYDGTGDDERACFGIFFNPSAQWRAESREGTWVWGTGSPPTGSGLARWCVSLFHPGSTVCPWGGADPPCLLERTYLEPPLDRFGYRGRQYWLAGLDRDYDAEHDGPASELVFATRGASPDGLFVLRRDLVEAYLATHGAEEVDLGSQLAHAIVAVLDTHPEFQNVDASHSDAYDFLSRWDLNGVVQSFAPHLFRLPGKGSSVSDTWMCAVPCGTLALDPELAAFDQHPEWAPPSRYAAAYDHLLVRLWNVQDPSPAALSTQVPLEIIGPDTRSLALAVESVEWHGRVLLFVTDHGGRIFVYDVTHALQTAPGHVELLDRWVAPGGVYDEYPNTMRSVVLDEASWTDAGVSHEELYIYAGVQRRGVEMLRWNDAESRLVAVGLLETPSDAHWLAWNDRALPGGEIERRLLIADGIGLRAYRRDH
jgi:hypothetical protein